MDARDIPDNTSTSRFLDMLDAAGRREQDAIAQMLAVTQEVAQPECQLGNTPKSYPLGGDSSFGWESVTSGGFTEPRPESFEANMISSLLSATLPHEAANKQVEQG